MKKVSLLALLVFLVALLAVLAVVGFLPGSFFSPLFAGPPGCDKAMVAIYNGDYNPVTKEVTLQIKNQGLLQLQLESLITDGKGKTTKHSKIVYLRPGGSSTVSFGSVPLSPAEWTVRDVKCGTADLWKKF